jgi:hypothetical protein
MASKRAALPGLLGGVGAKYPTLIPRTKRSTIVTIVPTGGFQPNNPTIKFDFKLGPSELAR